MSDVPLLLLLETVCDSTHIQHSFGFQPSFIIEEGYLQLNAFMISKLLPKTIYVARLILLFF